MDDEKLITKKTKADFIFSDSVSVNNTGVTDHIINIPLVDIARRVSG